LPCSTSQVPRMKPNENSLKTHLNDAPFLAGADCGKWGLFGGFETVDLTWPIFWVRSDKRIIQDGRIHRRFNTENYPQQATTACPWDINTNMKLGPTLWPKGPSVATVFNPMWKNDALYAPCDRVAMQGHDVWKVLCPQWWWQPSSTIVTYLEFVYVCLNPADYENN
jgi:hypothetical protein